MKVADNLKRKQRKVLKHYRENLDKRGMSVGLVQLKKSTKNDIDKIIFVAHQPIRVISVGKHN